MAMTTCKECKAQISTTAEACPHCGAKRRKPSGCATLLLVLLGLFILSAMMRACSGDSTPTATSEGDATTSGAASPPAAETKKDPAAEFAESKSTVEAIEARLKENAEHLKGYYGSKDQVKAAGDDLIRLAVIKGFYANDKDKERQALSKRAAGLIDRVAAQQRQIYASAMEEIFVKSGMDVKVTAGGAKKDRLTLKYVLMSKPMVYKLDNEVKLSEQARTFGFKKITYTDGYNESWNQDL